LSAVLSAIAPVRRSSCHGEALAETDWRRRINEGGSLVSAITLVTADGEDGLAKVDLWFLFFSFIPFCLVLFPPLPDLYSQQQ